MPQTTSVSGRVGLALRLSTLLVLLAVLGCATTDDDGPRVDFATQLGPYLDATIVLSGGDSRRLLFPATEACRSILRLDAPVRYTLSGSYGRVGSPSGETCDAVGAGDLERWRRGRRAGEMAPSSLANWSVLYEDDERFLLRGRFPLASRVGLTNTQDAVVMVANDELCEPVARSGASNLVFRTAGRPALALGLCPVLAVAMPL